MTSQHPPDPQQPDPLGTARFLGDALHEMSEQVRTFNESSEKRDAELKKSGRRTRWGLWIDVALTVVVFLLAWQNNGTSDRAASADARAAAATAEANATRVSSIAACESTNVARAENEQLWTYVITLFEPRPGESPAEIAHGDQVLAKLRARVDHTFAPRNCTALYSQGASNGSR